MPFPAMQQKPIRMPGIGTDGAQSCLEPLRDPGTWQAFIDLYATMHSRQTRKICEFTDLLPRSAELADQILTCSYAPDIPQRLAVNKMDGRRKRLVYLYPRADELLMKISSRLIAVYAGLLPDCCHAFRVGHSARGAFQSLLRHPGLDSLACIRADITDFFNSIDPAAALAALPQPILDDQPLMAMLREVMLQGSFYQDHCRQDGKPAGIKPGTSLAPLLANFFLADLDRYFTGQGYLYARYSDDIILFVPAERQAEAYADLTARLAAKGLSLNLAKTQWLAPGERWEYLGFSYDHGRIDLSDAAVKKLQDRVRRLARRLNRYRCRNRVPPERILFFFFRRLNGRLYGYNGRPTRFCWTRWYLPVINTAAALGRLDAYIQEAARFACTGHYRRKNYRTIPYARLQAAGCRPLLPYYYDRGWRRRPLEPNNREDRTT